MHTQDSSNILLETEGKDMSPLLVPLLSSVGASFVIFKWEILPKFQSPQEWVQLGGTVASISATMLGFMLAALAVLASINHTQLISMMRRTGLYEDLLLTLFVGCFMFLVCASFGYILLFGFFALPWLMSVLIGSHIGALISVINVARKFWLVLKNLK